MSALFDGTADEPSGSATPAGDASATERRRGDTSTPEHLTARAATTPSDASDDEPQHLPRRGRWASDSDKGDFMTTARNTEQDQRAPQPARPAQAQGATKPATDANRPAGGSSGSATRTTSGRSDANRFARPADAPEPRRNPRVVSNSGVYKPTEQRRSASDLISQLTPEVPQKATRGWRSWFGLKPSQSEADEFRDLATVKTVFRRPVTVMVANPKGGSGKTPTSVLLAGAFGLHRGGGVVAWDNNELRGTMPDRTFSPHRRNVHDMLAKLEQLRWSTSQFTDLAYFLNHQDTGNFYALGSAQHAGHVVTGQNFRQVHELFARYFQVIVVDTGNNEAAPNWTAAAAEADCLVVPTKWRKDSLIPAARMLESLQDTNPGLLDRTVIAATNGPEDSQKGVKASGASWFGSNHPIVEIPTDPHIAEGGVIDYSLLHKDTRRAALRLAAEVSLRLVGGGLAQE